MSAGFVTTAKITIDLYFDAAKKASKSLLRNWTIPLASIASYFVLILLTQVISAIPGSGGGFTPQGLILGLIITALLALYYGWLEAATKEQRVKFQDLWRLDGSLFFAILGVGFALWLLNLALALVLSTEASQPLLSACRFGIFIAFNAVSEIIYIQRRDGVDALRESLSFLKENWLEWFIPMLLILLPAISLVGSSIFFLLAQGDPLLPPIILLDSLLLYFGLGLGPSVYGPLILGVVIVTWFMIFRGYLFRKLSTSSRRARLFKQSL